LSAPTWFDRYVWRRRRASRELEQRAITSLPWNVGDPLHPAAVTFDRAASFGAVFGAWRYLADQIATLPLHAYRDLGDRRQRLGSLPQLFQQPAVQGTLVDWLFRAVIAMASRGNAVGVVTARDGFGFPTGVEWTDPDEWRVDDEPPNGSVANPVWWWLGRHVPTADVIHIPWFPVPGRIWGLSPMAAYAATVQAALGAQEYAASWFAGGGAPPGTFKNETQTLEPKTVEAVKARLVKAIRTREPIVYGRDWTYTPISINPEEAQFIESQQLGATQIAAIYGVPPEKIGGQAGGALTYNTVELNQISAQTDAVRPWVTKLEAKFFQLLPERQYVKFGMDAVVRADTLTRHRVYEIDRKIGLRSIDELRALEDLEPLPDGQGADFAPLGQADSQAESQADSQADPADDGEGEPARPIPLQRPRAV
jgi:HK97 family phage portal protein